MNRPECESEKLIYSLETSPKLQLLFENSAVGETYLFHRIASDCLRIPRFSIKASEPGWFRIDRLRFVFILMAPSAFARLSAKPAREDSCARIAVPASSEYEQIFLISK